MSEHEGESHPHLRAHLSPADGISIIVGIVVGVSIFKSPPLIFSNVSGPVGMLGAWVLGGVLSLVGALCYAELATTYPLLGGDYAYLKRAYGGLTAFLFGWAQLIATLTGSIGAMAYVFADYAAACFGATPGAYAVWLACGSVLFLTIANILGAHVGKTVQNLLTGVKILGLSAIVLCGLMAGGSHELTTTQPIAGPGFGLAMIFVLYTFGGWNDAAFVAAEVKDRERNIPKVLILGTSLIVLIYLLVNVAYWWGLGFEGVRNSSAPAADVLSRVVGTWGARVMSVLVMMSSLGAINGLLYTGSRIYVSMGADHRLFAFLKRWDPRLNTPIWSLAASGAVALLMILVVGTQSGQSLVDRCVTSVGLAPLPWKQFGGGFDTLVAATSPIFWSFFLLTGLSIFSLREIDPDVRRPFRVPFYPFTPFAFCVTSLYMLYSSLNYAGTLALLGLIPLALGVPLYFVGRTERATR